MGQFTFPRAVVLERVCHWPAWVGPAVLASSHTHARLSWHRGLPTDRYMWSDATGLQECTKAGTKPPSLQWTWVSPWLGASGSGGGSARTDPLLPQVSDWFVDFSVSGGTDQEGWQYASDFPS